MVAASKQSKQSKAKVVQGTSVTAPEFAASTPAPDVAPPQVAPAAPDTSAVIVKQAKYHPRENNPKTGDRKHVWWSAAGAVFAANPDKPVSVGMLLAGGLSQQAVAYLLRRKRLVLA